MKLPGFLKFAACILLISFTLINISNSQTLKVIGVSDISRVYDDGYRFPVKYDTVKMFGIRGEIISGQAAINALKKLSNVTVEIDTLQNRSTGVSIPSVNINWNSINGGHPARIPGICNK